MQPGVKITDVMTGTGFLAETKFQVVVHVRGVFNHGEVFLDTRQSDCPMLIELGKREIIAGLRYGIVGMRVGGRRELVVSPHLGYGTGGLSGKIPPDAVLRFEVELLEVRESGLLKSEDYPSGRHLYFFWPGEMVQNRPRIQFGMKEDGRCGISLTVPPQSGFTWRHTKTKAIEHSLKMADVVALFSEIETFPQKHPNSCLNNEFLWADSSEKANSITRDLQTNTPCVTMGILEQNVWLCYYSMLENDPILLQSKIYEIVKNLAEQSMCAKQ